MMRRYCPADSLGHCSAIKCNLPHSITYLSPLTFFRFRDHPAEEVYVTGTFDDWQKTEKLSKNGDVFSKDVTLKNADEKIYYKVRDNGTS